MTTRSGTPSASSTSRIVGVGVAIVDHQRPAVRLRPSRCGRRTTAVARPARPVPGCGRSPDRSPPPPAPGDAPASSSITGERVGQPGTEPGGVVGMQGHAGDHVRPALRRRHRPAGTRRRRSRSARPRSPRPRPPTPAPPVSRPGVPLGYVQVAVRVDDGSGQRLGRSGRSTRSTLSFDDVCGLRPDGTGVVPAVPFLASPSRRQPRPPSAADRAARGGQLPRRRRPRPGPPPPAAPGHHQR